MTEVAHSLTHTVRSRKSSKGITARKPHPPVALVTPRTERKCDQTRIDEDGASDDGLCGDGTGSDKVVTPTSDEAELYFSGNLQLSSVIEGPSFAMCVQFSTDGKSIASGFADGTVKIHDFASGNCLTNMLANSSSDAALEPVTCVRFLKTNQLLIATYATGQVRYWDARSNKCLATLIEDRSTMAAAFNPSRTRLVTVGSTPEMYLYDVRTGQRLATLEARGHRAIMDGHRARVFAVQYHAKHPNIFLTGGWDDTVQYWDDRLPHAVRKFFGPHICGDALDIDVERGQVLTGSWRSEILYRYGTSTLATKLHDVPGAVEWTERARLTQPLARILLSSPYSQCCVENSSYGFRKVLIVTPRQFCSLSTDAAQLYCAQWLGKDHIISGGSDRNLVRTISRSAFNTTGQLFNLANGVYSIDSHHLANHDDPTASLTRIAVASSNNVYLMETAS